MIGAKRISREFGEYLERAKVAQPIPFAFDYTFDAPAHPLQHQAGPINAPLQEIRCVED